MTVHEFLNLPSSYKKGREMSISACSELMNHNNSLHLLVDNVSKRDSGVRRNTKPGKVECNTFGAGLCKTKESMVYAYDRDMKLCRLFLLDIA